MENTETDLLYEAASVFQSLQIYSLFLTIGRKGNSEEIKIIFDNSDFHHLAGLHKLTDINQVYKQNAKIVFKKIMKQEISYSNIENSSFIEQVKTRLTIIKSFKEIFSNPSTIFEFRKLVNPHSKIRWKYLLEFTYSDNIPAYLFLDEYRNAPGNYVCVSNFDKELDYSFQQIRYTLLQVVATNESTKSSEVWYKSKSYIPPK